jgi:hypothetical protein
MARARRLEQSVVVALLDSLSGVESAIGVSTGIPKGVI